MSANRPNKEKNYLHVSTSHSSQARAGRFRSSGGTYLQQVKSRLRAFKRGSSRSLQRHRPTNVDILSAARTVGGIATPFPTDTDSVPFIPGVSSMMPHEQAAVNNLAANLISPGHGYVPDKKPPHVIRMYGENVNSLSLYDAEKAWKTTRLTSIASRMQVDGMMIQECGVDFRQVPSHKSLSTLVGGADSRIVCANNVTEPCGRTQYGGVAAISFARLAGFTLSTGKDPTGLGRFAWMQVGTAERRTRIVTAYRPVKPARSLRSNWQRGKHTVWSQHQRYWKKMHETRNPIARFDTDLVSQLIRWKNAG